MRGVAENVSLTRLLAILNFANLRTDANEGVSEAVKLLFALTLCGFNHERVGNRPAHGGSVEAVVLQTLGNVDSLHASRLTEGAGINDEFVSTATIVIGVQDGIVVLEASKEVVGVEEGHGSGLAEALVACILSVSYR